MSIFSIDNDLKAFLAKAGPILTHLEQVAKDGDTLIANSNEFVTELRQLLEAFKVAASQTIKQP